MMDQFFQHAATTHGITVRVAVSYLADQSTPESDAQATAKLKEGLSKLGNNPATIESSSKVGPTIAQSVSEWAGRDSTRALVEKLKHLTPGNL